MLAASAAFACSRASSGVVRTKALSLGLKRSMRSRYARVSSVEETSRRRTAAAWSRADANGSMAVNGADSHARESRGALFWNGDQEATAGLRVAEHELVELRDAAPVDLIAMGGEVAPASVGKKITLRQVAHALHEGNRAQVDVGAAGQVGEVANEPIPGDVGGRGGSGLEHRFRRAAVEGGHYLDGEPLQGRRTEAALDRRRHQSRAERFGEEEHVSRSRTIVADQTIRMHLADHRVPELRLGVVDRVSAHDGDPGLGHLRRAACDDLLEQPGAQFLARERGYAQREEGPRANRVHVTDRVGGCDGAEIGRVVDEACTPEEMQLARATRSGMEELGREFTVAKPDVVVVATPHNVHISGAFAVLVAARMSGNLDGTPQPVELEVPSETGLAWLLLETLIGHGLPAVGVSFGSNDPSTAVAPMDWGVLIPLWFMGGRHDPPVPVVVITPARDLSADAHVRAGAAIAATAGASRRRVACIASSDHGHAHRADRS